MPSTTITFLGHSCFLLEYDGSKLLIDPGKKHHSEIDGDIVYSTHYHYDHTSGIEKFLKKNTPNSVLIANEQVTQKYSKFEDQIMTINDGETIKRGIWEFSFISGRHGFFRGVNNIGIVVRTPSLTFGHLGDSVNFSGFSQVDVDILAVPIGSMFAASPKGAIKELQEFKKPLPIIIPMHWLWRSPRGFCKKFKKAFPDARCIIPQDGEKISY